MSVSIAELRAEHHHDGFGLFVRRPRLSWRFNESTGKNWQQSAYDVVIECNGTEQSYHVESSSSTLVPWPSSELNSRDIVEVRVRAWGTDNSHTNWAARRIEIALLDREDWKARLIGGPANPVDEPKRPFRLRKQFDSPAGPARLYATAHGLYHIEINGRRVGNQLLAPGWQSYHHRLHYQIYDVTEFLYPENNVIGVYVGEGWYAGRLGRPGVSNIWGDRLGFLAQLEVNGEVVVKTDSNWEELGDGPVIASEIYNGEEYDSRLADTSWSKYSTDRGGSPLRQAEELPFPSAQLIAPDVAPVRKIMEIQPRQIVTTPSGKKVLDFGQNLVGWLRVNVDIPGPGTVIVRHGEVMESGELGTRPLRTARAQAVIHLGGTTKGYEPNFTWFGFRFAEISGFEGLKLEDFTAIVISSDLRRTGTFECSHELINRLHENTIWSMRANFVSVPTDCPQRDERLGWTGDIQVFAPTASYLYDTAAFLGSWLRDLDADQRDLGGIVPNIVPSIPIPPRYPEKRPMAIWGDCAILTPLDIYMSFGDQQHLSAQWDSMVLWLQKGVRRDERGFYSAGTPQYGDWLDPRSPPQLPGHSPTDPYLVANAYLVHVTQLVSDVASVIGKFEDARKYAAQAADLRERFRNEYISRTGRLASDTQAAYAIALRFKLLEGDTELATARSRLEWMAKWEAFKITTGFAGTPYILPVLVDIGLLDIAYRMLQEKECPSWLYPVTMGATTIWERWDSMLPDGSINPGQMTSFNHYALGSVSHFLHAYVAGLRPTRAGWTAALIKPHPGGTVRWAKATYDSPIGPYRVFWEVVDNKMKTRVSVPPNGEARVVLDGVDEVVRSGQYIYETEWHDSPGWPPRPIQGAQGQEVPDFFVP
ncbi:hypothetical protein GQ53DRAFT_712412 [Thozetella sp. PMI_491]|nr:hypothetical protein GQ53DRAFT_712412 [Thozetella sp. PMI_491]